MRSFGYGKTFGGIIGRCMPNSGHGGPPGTWVMTIVVFYVSAQIPSIEYFEVYGGLQAPGGISSSFSWNFPSNAVKSMSGGPIFGPSYDHIYKNVHLGQILTFGNALGPKIWQFYQIYRLSASKFLKLFQKSYSWKSKSGIFQIILKIWSPNPGFLK